MVDNSSSEPFWRVQYKLLLTALYQESNRFWTRFQVSLALNGGLLVAFSFLFNKGLEEHSILSLNLASLLIISGIGLALSVIWRRLTVAGANWQDYWIKRGAQLEKSHESELGTRIFSDLHLYEGAWGIRKPSGYIPIVFVIGWSLLVLWIIVFNSSLLREILKITG